MITHTEQRALIKICVLLGKSSSQINEELKQSCGESALPRSSVFDWARQFKEGRTSIEDRPRSGRPTEATDEHHVQLVEAEIKDDPRQTCEQIAYTLGISNPIVQRILTEHLNKRKVAARFVPHFFSDVQKWTRFTIATSLLSRYRREGFPFLRRIIAVDETLVHCYDPELKRQSDECRGPDEQRPTKFRQESSALKQMMIFAYTSERVIIADRVPPRATVNKEYYLNFIGRLRQALSRNSLMFWQPVLCCFTIMRLATLLRPSPTAWPHSSGKSSRTRPILQT